MLRWSPAGDAIRVGKPCATFHHARVPSLARASLAQLQNQAYALYADASIAQASAPHPEMLSVVPRSTRHAVLSMRHNDFSDGCALQDRPRQMHPLQAVEQDDNCLTAVPDGRPYLFSL